MLDTSGYRLLKDRYSKPYPDYNESTICISTPDREQEIFHGEQYRVNNMIDSLNMKSKYIESSPEDKPIIESKSISTYTVDTNYITSDDKKDLYKYYNYRELNTYPIRNYDLLDQEGDLPKKFLGNENYDKIFYDKLIINGNDSRSDVFKTIGPLYNVSIGNIPVLTKLNTFNIKDINIKFIVDRSKLNSLIDVLDVRKDYILNDDNLSVKYDSKTIVIFRIKEHYKTINTTYMNIQDVYIPNTIIYFVLGTNVNWRMENSYPSTYILKLGIGIIRNLDYFAYQIFNAYQNIEHLERDGSYKKIINEDLVYDSLLDIIKNRGNNRVRLNQIVPWPFGNVYDTFEVCMNISKTTLNNLYYSTFKDNQCSIYLHSIINGLYINFMDSTFNMDLQASNFFLKKDYERYLTFKESFMNKENGFREFIDTLDKYREEIKSKVDLILKY